MNKFIYGTKGTCSKSITFELDDEKKIHGVSFAGGCMGNLIAVGRLVEGMQAEEAIRILSGIDCHGRGTSCGDQLAKALRKALDGESA